MFNAPRNQLIPTNEVRDAAAQGGANAALIKAKEGVTRRAALTDLGAGNAIRPLEGNAAANSRLKPKVYVAPRASSSSRPVLSERVEPKPSTVQAAPTREDVQKKQVVLPTASQESLSTNIEPATLDTENSPVSTETSQTNDDAIFGAENTAPNAQEVGGASAVVREKPSRLEVAAKEGQEMFDKLEEDDRTDPAMVHEYAEEIFAYMHHLEVKTLANPTYMNGQDELKWRMRAILLDWMIEVHHKFALLPETLFLAVNLVDRFLSARQVALVKLQLVGVAGLFVAAKYEEVQPPSVQDVLYMADGAYSVEELLKAERYLLSMVKFDLSYPSPLTFLRRASKADGYDIQVRTLAKYFMEIALLDERFIAHVPSKIVASSLWLARKMLDKGPWHATFQHYSGGYMENELTPLADDLIDFMQNDVKKTAVNRKYSHKRLLRASLFVKEWLSTHATGDVEAQDSIESSVPATSAPHKSSSPTVG